MLGESETVYRFGGDAGGLLAELKAVRAALSGAANEAAKTGKALDGSLSGTGLRLVSKDAQDTTKRITDLSRATTSLGATSFVNINDLTTSLGATSFAAKEAGAAITVRCGQAGQSGDDTWPAVLPQGR